MQLNDKAIVYIPDENKEGIKRTTYMCIAAHEDDIEIMAYPPIAKAYKTEGEYFCGVCTTNGGGSPRSGTFANLTDDEMIEVRAKEQKAAADVGKYCAQVLLGYTSAQVKDAKSDAVVNDIMELIIEAKPEIVYTHNLADKHDTHVATALRVIEALKRLPDEYKPKKLITLEVWRGLDWVNDNEKLVLDASYDPALANACLAVFESQIAGGKRYDLATIGRRLANATFFESHAVDDTDRICFGLDATELMYGKDPQEFINGYITSFANDVNSRLRKFSI